jgi:protease I
MSGATGAMIDLAILCAPRGSEKDDVSKAFQEFRGAGINLVIVAPSDRIMLYHHLDLHDELSTDQRLEEIEPDRFAGLIIPGGLIGPYDLRANHEAQAFVDAMLLSGRPLAALGHGVWTLLGSSAIRGRRLAAPDEIEFDVRRAGAEHIHEGVCIDERLVSSAGIADNARGLSALRELILADHRTRT